MNAVMYGGGNIGRGFIGALLSQSGYRVTFIDVAAPVVEHLQKNECYPIRYVFSGGHEDVLVENVTAVNGNDMEAASDAIANCDIMATAVGARILKFIVPNIVAGLRKRWAMGDKPLNIIICENLMDANLVIEGMIKEQLTEDEKVKFDATVGLVEASIGRMVPVQTEEMKDGEPMRVCVERYGFLPTDGAAFKGGIPEIKNMVPFAPFDFYLKRKLYIHNMGHAMTAYLAVLKNYSSVHDGTDDAEIKYFVMRALIEAARGLAKRHGAPCDECVRFAEELVPRFENRLLMDALDRVGRDPKRKVGAGDRLGGAFKMVKETGAIPAYIGIGIAAAYLYRNEADATSVELTDYVKANGLAAALAKYSDITDAKDAEMIETFYKMLDRRAPFAEFLPVLAEILRTEH